MRTKITCLKCEHISMVNLPEGSIRPICEKCLSEFVLRDSVDELVHQ